VSRPWPLLFPIVIGCADPAESRFTATHEACGFAPREWEGVDYQYRHLDEVYPDEACVDRVLADFSADVDAFLAADDLDDPYGVVRGEDEVWSTRLGGLLSAAWALHAYDWGRVEDVRAGPAVDESFVERVRDHGDHRVGAALYDYVTDGIVETVPADGDEFVATWGGGTLSVFRPLAGATGAAILVHEARHADGGHHHRECADGTRACDRDLEGAYGFEAATIAAVLPLVRDEGVADHLSAHLDFALAHVQP
jgi:hypothetical protein